MNSITEGNLGTLGSGAFNLTGRTGSLMYMAPEVFNELPYAEKVICESHTSLLCCTSASAGDWWALANKEPLHMTQ